MIVIVTSPFIVLSRRAKTPERLVDGARILGAHRTAGWMAKA
jgi:hypothetical protein